MSFIDNDSFTPTVEFDTPANRIIAQQAPKNQFRIDPTLPDIAFLRQLSVQGRLFYQAADAINNDVIPSNGSTFFCYSLVISNASSTARTITASNDGQTRLQVNIGPFDAIVIPLFDSLVGDGIKIFRLDSNVLVRTSILGWNENTSRIRDVAI